MNSLKLHNDTVAFLLVEYHAGGGLSVQGNIGDAKLALSMCDHARDAIKTHRAGKESLIIPSSDVVVPMDPRFPVKPVGDMGS